MHAEIRTVKDPILRVKVVEERTSFDQSPMVWIENYESQQQELRDRIVAAQKLLPTVEIDYDLRVKISEVCSQLDVDGLRGDIVTNRAAKAHAAYNGRDKVTVEDISKIITLCLRHRLRKDPLESIDSGDKVSKVLKKFLKLKINFY
jgi:magnesium chelatase subunit I